MKRSDRQDSPIPRFQIGYARMYAVRVNNTEVPFWEAQGFIASRARPIMLNLPPDQIWVWGVPSTLNSYGLKNLLGRQTDKTSIHLGGCGMHGCGFFGLRFAPDQQAPQGEYLVFPKSYDAWRYLEISLVDTDESQHTNEQKQLRYSKLEKKTLVDASLSKSKCQLILSDDQETWSLTIRLIPSSDDGSEVPPPHFQDVSIGDVLIVHESRGILVG